MIINMDTNFGLNSTENYWGTLELLKRIEEHGGRGINLYFYQYGLDEETRTSLAEEMDTGIIMSR